MVCVAACPTGAICAGQFTLDWLVGHISPCDTPVVACSKVFHEKANVRLPCIGYLTKDILLAVEMSLKKPLQINAINCSECPTGVVLQLVKNDISQIRRNLPGEPPLDIKVIEDEHELNFQHNMLSRRDFLGKFRKDLRSMSQPVLDAMEMSRASAYRTKALPEAREALNTAMSAMAEDEIDVLLSAYYYDVMVTASCNWCGLCVGLCPSGAFVLKRIDDADKHVLFFNTWLCSGCGLCREACPEKAVSLQKSACRTNSGNRTSAQRHE